MNRFQQTIHKETRLSGVGLHTGCRVKVTFKPAPVNHGIVFVRTDLPGSPAIPADIDLVVEIVRGTTLAKGDVRIYTVEHVMAAAMGLEIDNLTVELDNHELPVGDGSALPYVEKLLEAGIVEQDAPKNFLEIDQPMAYSEPGRSVDLVVLPSDDFRVTFMIDYRNPALGTQYTTLVSLKDEFVKEFAPARTFCFLQEVEELKKVGLIKGGSLDSAIVICDDTTRPTDLDRLRHLFNDGRKLFVGKTGILNDTTLRFPNEPVRHKAIDLMGDLYLIGVPLRAHILAARSGHAANVALAKRIRALYEKEQVKKKYQQRTVAARGFLLDSNAILKLMPHRYPLLLIDRIIDIEPRKRVTAIKNVTINEPFFVGHFPGHPIMPGVLIIEAMAQAGGLLLLHDVEEPEKKVVYFMGIDKVRFRRPVLPGDQLRFELEMVSYRLQTCKMVGKAYVGNELVTEAEMMAKVMDR